MATAPLMIWLPPCLSLLLITYPGCSVILNCGLFNFHEMHIHSSVSLTIPLWFLGLPVLQLWNATLKPAKIHLFHATLSSWWITSFFVLTPVTENTTEWTASCLVEYVSIKAIELGMFWGKDENILITYVTSNLRCSNLYTADAQLIFPELKWICTVETCLQGMFGIKSPYYDLTILVLFLQLKARVHRSFTISTKALWALTIFCMYYHT